MEVSATGGGAFTTMKGDTGDQQVGPDNNNLATTTAPAQQESAAINKQVTTNTQQQENHNATTCMHENVNEDQVEVNGLLESVLTRIVSELSLNQDSTSVDVPASAAPTAKQQQSATSSPSLSPDDATCDLVIDSASNSADNHDSETQEPPASFGTSNRQEITAMDSSSQEEQKSLSSNGSSSGKVAAGVVPSSVVMQTDEPLIQSTNLMPITDQPHDDDDQDKIKDIVTLRNLEITPPPPIPTPPVTNRATTTKPPPPQPPTDDQLPEAETSDLREIDKRSEERRESEIETGSERETSKKQTAAPKATAASRKRARASDMACLDTAASGGGTSLDDSVESTSSSRSKRLRTQTKLFQVGGEVSPSYCESPTHSVASSSKSKSSTSARKTPREKKKTPPTATATASTSAPPPPPRPAQPPVSNPIAQHTNDLQGVIFYEKNDYLAIRNEENSFYLCQLTENVRVTRPMIKVRWLDTKDDKNYFLTALYDHVPQLSILMPVNLTKLKQEHKGEQMFALSNQDRDNILDRLKRSLNASAINKSSSSSTS